MNYIDYRIALDLHDIGSQHFLTMKQAGTAYRIFVTLTEAGEPYQLTEGCTAVFAGTKADGNIIFNNCTIDGNTICYEVTGQTTAALGRMSAEIRLYSPDALVLVSSRFTISVVPAVLNDSAVIESMTEVKTLSTLISEATVLITNVNDSLDRGDFTPKFSVGAVTTLLAGQNATVEITGTGAEPVLNFGIPQGPQGQAEHLIPDTELSTESLKPVQNKVIAVAVNELAEAIRKVDEENTESLNTLADELTALETEKVDNKVDKVTGKGLSTNDFTDAEKEKLAGIEAGANNFVLADKAVTPKKLDRAYATLDSNGKVNAPQIFADMVFISSSTYTPEAAHLGKLWVFQNTCVVTIPADTDYALLPLGTEIEMYKAEATNNLTVQLANASGDFRATNGIATTLVGDGDYSYIVLKRLNATSWIAKGDIE